MFFGLQNAERINVFVSWKNNRPKNDKKNESLEKGNTFELTMPRHPFYLVPACTLVSAPCEKKKFLTPLLIQFAF